MSQFSDAMLLGQIVQKVNPLMPKNAPFDK